MLLKQDDNANNVILFKLFEVTNKIHQVKKNKLVVVRFVNKNFDMTQQSINLSKHSASTKCNNTMG